MLWYRSSFSGIMMAQTQREGGKNGPDSLLRDHLDPV
jgi:hypothetical protein